VSQLKLDITWVIGGIPGGVIGGWGHARGNVGGWFGGLRPDNADDYRNAFDAAKERTQFWLTRWNNCCQKDNNGNWTKKCNRNDKDCGSPPDYKGYDWADKAPPGSR